MTRKNIKTSIIIILLIFVSCTEKMPVEFEFLSEQLCYKKSVDGQWEVFINYMDGSEPKNISNSLRDDEYPLWSPDGKYISYLHSESMFGPNLYIYNVENNSYINLTADGGGVHPTPYWTLDNKVFCTWTNQVGDPQCTYLMNIDGSEKKKLLDHSSQLYFYDDCYTFLYLNDNKIYKSNLDGSINVFLFDRSPETDKYLTIRDFDPYAKNLLINTNTLDSVQSAIIELNTETLTSRLIVSAEEGFSVHSQRYSKDFKTIAFLETNEETDLDRYLSVFKNNTKRRLVHLHGAFGAPGEWFDGNPMHFSDDGKYIVFVVNTSNDGFWVSWKSNIYVVEVATGNTHWIDKGKFPSWKPKTN